jgi:hypothetical protein
MTAGRFLACALIAPGGLLLAACASHSDSDAASAGSATTPVQPDRGSDVAEGGEPSLAGDDGNGGDDSGPESGAEMADEATDAEAQEGDASATELSEGTTDSSHDASGHTSVYAGVHTSVDAGGHTSVDAGGHMSVDAGDQASVDAGGHDAPTGAGYPAGWLYTSGAKIYESNGSGSGTQWMGRGVNIDDIFFCGYNNSLWMSGPDTTLEQVISALMTGWKPSFVRVSLAMDSYGTPVSWLSDPSQYKTPMVDVINTLAGYSGVHVLVTLRSDASMMGQDTGTGDPEATGIPSSSATTPNASEFPTGTDAVYVALVDAFANSGAVMFGLSNEPGGNTASNSTLAAAMNHAVGVIRTEENRLGVSHHIVSVQGNSWTSNIAFYAEASGGGYPDGGSGLITYDNVVYEVHGYPPPASEYTYPNIPVILGEYGSLPASDAGTDTTFFDDIETKQIPNLAWDFEPFTNCSPDLVDVTANSTDIVATSPWGTMVKSYLLAHAP